MRTDKPFIVSNIAGLHDGEYDYIDQGDLSETLASNSTMKPLSILLYLTPVVFAAPVSKVQDQNATIWAQSAVTAMRVSTNAIYNANVDLYNHRTIFDQPHLPCQAPSAHGQGTDTVCAQADKARVSSIFLATHL